MSSLALSPHGTPSHGVPDARRDVNLPFAAAGVFYALAIFGTILPMVAQVAGAERTAWLLFLPTAAVYAVLTLLVLYRQAEDVRARLFMFFGFAVTLSQVGNALYDLVDSSLSPRNLAYLFLFSLIYLVNAAVLVHFAAFVPRTNPLVARRPALIYLPYLAGVLLALVVYVGYLDALRPFLPGAWTLDDAHTLRIRLTAATYLASGIAILSLLGYAARRDESALRRRQALILWAGFLPWTVHVTTFVLFPARAFLPGHWVFEQVILLLVPASCYVSIAAFRLFEIGAVVRRFLVFGLTVGVLVLAVYAGAALVDAVAGAFMELDVMAWGPPLFLLAAGAFVRPVLHAATTFVDRRFFHERIELERLEQVLLSELAAFATVDAIASELASRVRGALKLTHAAVLVRDPTGDFYRLRGRAGELPGHVEGVEVMAAETLDPLELRGDHVVPIRLHERSIGLLVLGPSLNDWEPEHDDRVRLERIAGQAAALLDNANLLDLASNDQLTGLPRRQVVEDRIAQEVARSRRVFRPFAVALADIDDFKRINDEFGHHVGDDALRRVAAEFAARRREIDAIGRFGGEEFVFLFAETQPAGVLAYLETLRERIAQTAIPTDRAGAALAVTISFGVRLVASPGEVDDPAALLRQADTALYRAKRGGKNRVEIEPPQG